MKKMKTKQIQTLMTLTSRTSKASTSTMILTANTKTQKLAATSNTMTCASGYRSLKRSGGNWTKNWASQFQIPLLKAEKNQFPSVVFSSEAAVMRKHVPVKTNLAMAKIMQSSLVRTK